MEQNTVKESNKWNKIQSRKVISGTPPNFASYNHVRNLENNVRNLENNVCNFENSVCYLKTIRVI